MFLIATAACVLVIMSLVHFLMALSANYAHIRGHDKFTDFVDLHNIDMTSESVQLTEVSKFFVVLFPTPISQSSVFCILQISAVS